MRFKFKFLWLGIWKLKIWSLPDLMRRSCKFVLLLKINFKVDWTITCVFSIYINVLIIDLNCLAAFSLQIAIFCCILYGQRDRQNRLRPNSFELHKVEALRVMTGGFGTYPCLGYKRKIIEIFNPALLQSWSSMSSSNFQQCHFTRNAFGPTILSFIWLDFWIYWSHQTQKWGCLSPSFLVGFLLRKRCEYWWWVLMLLVRLPFCTSSSWER